MTLNWYRNGHYFIKKDHIISRIFLIRETIRKKCCFTLVDIAGGYIDGVPTTRGLVVLALTVPLGLVRIRGASRPPEYTVLRVH